jgi:hypothetical protein
MAAQEGCEAFLQLAALAAAGLFGDALKGEAEVPRASFPWKIVRWTEVTGIPSSTVRSSGGACAAAVW